MSRSTFSVVIPLLNEQESIPELYARLTHELERMTEGSDGNAFELIFIDDGSTDGTFRLLRELATVDSRVVAIRFRQRYGKTAALAAGFERRTAPTPSPWTAICSTTRKTSLASWRSWRRGMTSSAAGARSGSTISGCAAFLRVSRTG